MLISGSGESKFTSGVVYAHAHSISWLAWTCDALDFFTVSLTLPLLATQFGVGKDTMVRFHRPEVIMFIALRLITYIDDRHHPHLALQISWCCAFSFPRLSAFQLTLC